MTNSYRYSIFWFLLFSILLLLSSVMLFELKIGFSIESITSYYLGDEEKFIAPKTYMGTLKIALPHIFAFGLFAMVLLHFGVFTSSRDSLVFKLFIYLIYLSAFLELLSPYLIIHGYESFAYIKLISFFVFESLLLYVLWVLGFSIVYK